MASDMELQRHALRALAPGLPEPPAPALDPYLDAAVRCFARHGVKRTTVPDVADELGVSRATIYRQVGTVDTLLALALARELHRLAASLLKMIDEQSGADTVVEMVLAAVTHAREHPAFRKILEDEPELMAPYLVEGFEDVVAQVAAVVCPAIERGMHAGVLRRRDPAVIADWLVRMTVSVTLAPPPGSLRRFLEQVVLPVLETGDR